MGIFSAQRPIVEKVECKPLTSQAIYSRLKYYLHELNLDDGETPHSFRSACAIMLTLAGATVNEVMSHVGWWSKRSPNHYMQLHKSAKAEAPASRLVNAITNQAHVTSEYEALESMIASSRPAFPLKQ